MKKMIIQYYSHLCTCGCGGKIEIKKWHKWEGIPHYISGHNPTKGFTKHGDYKTKLYGIWASMKQRILNTNHKAYYNYGGRGITICQEWVNDYILFRDWALNNGYSEGLSIDRKDPNKGYNSENCEWVTLKENGRKQRTNKLSLQIANEIRILYNSGYYTQKQVSEKYNVSQSLINGIINNKKWA